MNPVISAQAHTLTGLIKAQEMVKAQFLLEQSHLPYDVQDLIFAALAGLPKINDDLIAMVLEECVSTSSFDERLCH